VVVLHLQARSTLPRQTMTNSNEKPRKEVRGIDWDAIFERRPDLIPPGYAETIAKLYPSTTEENDDA